MIMGQNEKLFEKIVENFDLVFALTGFILGIFIIYLSLAYGIHQQDIGGAIFLASSLYLLLRKRFFELSETFYFNPSKKIIYLNNILFFLALTYSVWLLYTNLYSRPLMYFIIVAIACASIALEILYTDSKETALILSKIILIGITLYGGIYYEFPGIYGVDPHYHNGQIEIYIEEGHIVPTAPIGYSNGYYSFPIFHILAASTSILTQLNIYDSIFSSIAFSYILSSIFVFLIGKKLINTKAGLFAALLLMVGDYRIVFGITPIPMTLGIVFYTILLYLLYINTPQFIIRRSIAIVFLLLIVLTHSIAGFITFVTLMSLFLSKTIYNHLSGNVIEKFKISWNTTLVYLSLLFSYWMYAFKSYQGEISFFESSVRSLTQGLSQDAEFATSVTEKISPMVSTSYFDYLLDHVGYLIFLGIGIVGIYIWLREKDEFKVPFSITMVVLFAFLYGFSLMGLRSIIPTRWFAFAYIFLAILFALGLLKSINLFTSTNGTIIAVVLIFIVSFFMITSTISNDDSPLYNKIRAVQQWQKSSELQGGSTINRIFNGSFGLINSEMLSPDYNYSKDTGKLYVLNRDAFIRPIYIPVRSGIYEPLQLDYDFEIRLKSKSNGIYNNGQLQGYLVK